MAGGFAGDLEGADDDFSKSVVGDWDCALKAAAMAMAPLTPVPATRQITVW